MSHASASSNAAVRHEPVGGEDGGHRQVLEGLLDPEQPRPEIGAAADRLGALGDVPEERDVDPGGDDLAARLDQHRAGAAGLERVGQRDQFGGHVLQRVEHGRREEVQGRAVQDDDGDVAVPLDPDGRCGVGHAPILQGRLSRGATPSAAAEDVQVDVEHRLPGLPPGVGHHAVARLGATVAHQALLDRHGVRPGHDLAEEALVGSGQRNEVGVVLLRDHQHVRRAPAG